MVQVHVPSGVEVRVLSWAPQIPQKADHRKMIGFLFFLSESKQLEPLFEDEEVRYVDPISVDMTGPLFQKYDLPKNQTPFGLKADVFKTPP